MDRVSPVERSGSDAREYDEELCPSCAARPRRIITMLDSRKGKTVRIYECRCGKIIWHD